MAKRGALKIGETRNGVTRISADTYKVSVSDGKGSDGSRRRIYRNVRGTEADAQEVRAQLLTDRKQGKAIGTDRQPLSEYIDTWLSDKRRGNRPGMKVRTVTPATWARYVSLLEPVLRELGDTPLGNLTSQHLSDLYHRWETLPRSTFEPPAATSDEIPKRSHRSKDAKKSDRSTRPYSTTTIHHRHVALKLALDDAVKRYRLIPVNPAGDATVPSPRPPMPDRGEDTDLHVLDETQLARLYDAADATDLGLLVYLAGNTGARLGELLALRASDFDSDRSTLRIDRALAETNSRTGSPEWYTIKSPKSAQSRRTVKVGPIAAGLLTQAIEEQRTGSKVARIDGLLFTTVNGEPLRPSSVSQRFHRLAAGLGFHGLRFHDLRHTHATIALKRGESVHVLSKRLGHANVSTTLRMYSHVLPGQDEDLAIGFEDAVEGKRHVK